MAGYQSYKIHGHCGKREFTVHINKGEIYQIEQWVLKREDIETGGDLFGLWIDDRTAIVQFVLGPGKRCRRTSVSFFQDIEYLRKAGNYLTQGHGLCNIGQWHSHHRLGLTRPSGGDENTVWGNMPNLGLDRYIVFIATIHYEKSVMINPYLFEIEGRRRNDVLHGTFQYMEGNSPFRLDKTIQDQNEIKHGAEVLNKVKKFKPDTKDERGKNLKRKHINENEPTESGTKQSKPEVSGSTTNHVNVETQNGEQLHNQDVKADQRGRPNSLQGENVGSNVQDNSITPALDEGDDMKIDIDSDSCSTSDLQKENEQNSSQVKSKKEGSDEPGKDEDQTENENHDEQVACDYSEGDQMRQPNSPGNGNEVQNKTTTQESKVVDEQNNAGDKVQVEKKDDELLDGGGQPDSPRDESKIHDDSIAQGSLEDDEQNRAGDKYQVEKKDDELLDGGGQPDSPRDDSKIHDDSITRRSHEGNEHNSAGDKDHVENENGEHVDNDVVEDYQSANSNSLRDVSKIHGDSIAQGSLEDDEQNSAGDKDQIKNVDGEHVDNEILKDNKSRQTNSPRGDSKGQVDSIAQRSHEDDEKQSAGDKDQVKNLDGGQTGSDGFEHQKKKKKPDKPDDQFSTSHIQKDNEQNNSHGPSAGKNLDDLDSNDRPDQNVETNVLEGVSESHLKQNFDESSQYKMFATQGIDHTEFKRFEEKERESDKDNATVNDNDLSNPGSKGEEMQTDVDVRNENGSPKTTQAVEGGDENETQVETMDIDNVIFSSNNEPAEVDQGTFEMETESIKEPTSVNEMNCERPPMSMSPEETTDPNKNQQTQDLVMSIEEDSQTQGDDNESKKMVNDEEIENKSSENISPLQDLNDHNAADKMIDNEENNPAAQPIEDEHSLILSIQNGNEKKGLTSESAVNEPEEQDSCMIPPSKMDNDEPTSNINDKLSKMSTELASDSKQNENATCSHDEQSVDNPGKKDSVNVKNSSSNENIESDPILTDSKQKEANMCNFDKVVTLQELPSSETTMLKKDKTSNNDISINDPTTNAAAEESNSEQIKETETTSSDQMADQNEQNAHGNIVEQPTIGRKIQSNANEYPQSSAKDERVGGNEENNRSQSMHWDLSNKNTNNRRSRSIFDRPESPHDVANNEEATAAPGEGIASTSTDEETKLERKNCQDDHVELKSKQDLLELESKQENVCDIELPSFEGTDPETDKSIKNQNQNKENPGVSEKIEAKNETVDDPIAQKQQEEMEQIGSIPEREPRRRNEKRKMKIPKKLKRMLGKKNERDKNDKKKKKGILRRLFKKKSNKISESKKEKTSAEASTASASGNNDSCKNTVTNKTKDEGIDTIEVIENNEGDTDNYSEKVAKKGKITSRIWKKKKKESKKTSEFIDGNDRDTRGNTKEELNIETSKKKKKDGKKEKGKKKGKEESSIETSKKKKKDPKKEEGKKKRKREKTKNKNKKASKLVKGKDGDIDENIQA